MSKLKQGMSAPRFSTVTLDGRALNLTDFRGRMVWLMFYRYPGCPLCNLHMSSLLIRRKLFEQYGLSLIVVFESSSHQFPESLVLNRLPNMYFIPDDEKKLYGLYGVQNRILNALLPQVAIQLLRALRAGFRQGYITGNLGTTPAHFLIDEKGFLGRAYYGKHIGDHIRYSEVEAFLSERRLGEFSLALPEER